MGFLSSAEKLDSASKIKQWNEQALSNYNAFQTNKQSIINQLELMKLNEDYSQSDCDEVQLLVDALNDLI